MERIRALLLAFLVALSVAAGGTASAQGDVVTLTVSVETPSGDAVGGATLTASWDGGSTSGTTVSNGKVFMDVPAGEDVEISVEHDDYVRNFPATVADASGDEVSVTVWPKATARITVTDGGSPVPDATVKLRKDGRDVDVVDATTDDDGVVTSDTVESGEYTVVVSKSGYFVNQEEIDVSGNTGVEVSIERGTVTLEVNVTDDHFQPPRSIGGATVDVRESGSVVTQPGGIGRISVPVNAWARVDVSKDGYQTTTQSVFVSERDLHLDVTIRRTPAISTELLSQRVVIGERVALTVTDEYGDPVAGAVVRLDGEEVAETAEDGSAVVQVSEAGNHSVTVQTGSLSAEPKTVVGVGEGEATDDVSETADPETTGEGTEAELPGFGVVVALFALVVAVLVGHVRRSE